MNKTQTPQTANPAPRQATYTPEPWRQSAYHDFKIIAKSRGDASVCDCTNILFANPDEQRENTERIIACVNALARVNNPAAVKQLIEFSRKLVTAFYDGKDDEKGAAAFVEIEKALAALDAPVPKE